MKKLLSSVYFATGITILVMILIGVMLVDSYLKSHFESSASKLTSAEVNLGALSVSPLTGSGRALDLHVGNPVGFNQPFAISLDSVTFAVKPSSFFADKLVVERVHVRAGEVTLENRPGGDNIQSLLDRVNASIGDLAAALPPGSTQPGKVLQVNDFRLTDAKVKVVWPLSGRVLYMPLPDIHLTDLGTAPEGITGAELAQIVLARLRDETLAALGKELVSTPLPPASSSATGSTTVPVSDRK